MLRNIFKNTYSISEILIDFYSKLHSISISEKKVYAEFYLCSSILSRKSAKPFFYFWSFAKIAY